MLHSSLRAFRCDGEVVTEIDEHRFSADAFLQSESRILDRDAFLAFACGNLFSVLYDAPLTRSRANCSVPTGKILGRIKRDGYAVGRPERVRV